MLQTLEKDKAEEVFDFEQFCRKNCQLNEFKKQYDFLYNIVQE